MACTALFTCAMATAKAGGSCDCHSECGCDTQNASGLGATHCLGGTCTPRCTEQKDPRGYCQCASLDFDCAPSGECASRLDTSSDAGICADAGPG